MISISHSVIHIRCQIKTNRSALKKSFGKVDDRDHLVTSVLVASLTLFETELLTDM